MTPTVDLETLEGRLARRSRWIAVWSLVGAALVLIALVHGSMQLTKVEQARQAAQADLKNIEVKLQTDQQAAQAAEAKLAQLNAEIEIANKAYQQLSKYVPPGTAEAAVQQAVQSTPGQATLVPLIYLHVASEEQRPFAVQLGDKLRGAGYQVAKNIETVGNIAPQHSQLRYFFKTDNDAATQRILGQLKSWGVDARAVYVGMDPKTSLRVLRPKQFELWLGSEFQPPR